MDDGDARERGPAQRRAGTARTGRGERARLFESRRWSPASLWAPVARRGASARAHRRPSQRWGVEARARARGRHPKALWRTRRCLLAAALRRDMADSPSSSRERSFTPAPGGAERRRQPRCPLGLPVRLLLDGVPFASTVELRDVSIGGGFLCTDDRTPAVLADQEVAIGFVLPSREVGLARGKVLRIVPGMGFAVVFDRANDAFQGFVLSLIEGWEGAFA